ncbi:GDYXXLXY domain-containing protein [Peribacillus asahii]|nr:GDYXXLXY domain-containing protein [Peribacillus asahii]USK85560.1 GDYXXLXY domain-containing protein [Peribacillus asahii]
MKNNLFMRILVFSIPVLLLIGLAIPPTWTSLTGEEIRLKTEPIDPTDLFRGSYVTLYYEIEQVTSEQLSDSVVKEMERKSEGDILPVFVQLEKGSDDIYNVKKVTNKKPSSGVYLKGTLNIPYEIQVTPPESFHIQYNLDNYYAPKKDAEEIEAVTSTKPALAIVKVKNGRAILMDIIVP